MILTNGSELVKPEVISDRLASRALEMPLES